MWPPAYYFEGTTKLTPEGRMHVSLSSFNITTDGKGISSAYYPTSLPVVFFLGFAGTSKAGVPRGRSVPFGFDRGARHAGVECDAHHPQRAVLYGSRTKLQVTSRRNTPTLFFLCSIQEAEKEHLYRPRLLCPSHLCVAFPLPLICAAVWGRPSAGRLKENSGLMAVSRSFRGV